MRILLFFLVVFPFAAFAYDALVPEPSEFTVHLSPYALKSGGKPIPPGQKIGALIFRDAVEMKNESYRFGGFSSLNIIGDQLYSLSDEGRLLRATLRRKDMKITELAAPGFTPLWQEGEAPSEKSQMDSEALVHLKGDRFAVGFEQRHRITFYRIDTDIAEEKTLAAPTILNQLTEPNQGIEALVQLAPGKLLAITEAARDAQGNTIAYLVNTKKEHWQQLGLKTTGNFRPTDLTILNKKYLLLLERSYSMLNGMEARISLIVRKDIKSGAIITPLEIAHFDNQSGIDNMEGIQALPHKDGSAEIFLISDDNLNPLQHTILVWLSLPKQYRPAS